MNKDYLFKTLKIVVAAVLAIIVAGEIGLKYYPTAGIITVLSIQNTKRETLKTALNRACSYLCAIVLAAGAYYLMGFTLWAFGVYLFIFVLLCMVVGWKDGIVMNSVLVTHFMTEQSMTWPLILNETLLFVIGVGFGIIINLHLKRKGDVFERSAAEVDNQIKKILCIIAEQLKQVELNATAKEEFEKLHGLLDKAKHCAVENYNNNLRKPDETELNYIRMREHQSDVLEDIEESVKMLKCFPKQSEQVAELFNRTEQCFHKDNTVEELLADLEGLFGDMKSQMLPQTRDEFEARAILFYILMQMKSLLQIKRDFVLENIRR